jgi:hypothetical protein
LIEKDHSHPKQIRHLAGSRVTIETVTGVGYKLTPG